MKIAPTKSAARSGPTGQARRKQRPAAPRLHVDPATPSICAGADPCSHPSTGISLLLRGFRNAPRAGRWPPACRAWHWSHTAKFAPKRHALDWAATRL